MQGLAALCKHLLTVAAFVQICVVMWALKWQNRGRSFCVGLIFTGINAFMTSGDVMHACKKRLVSHAAPHLETMYFLHKEINVHTCIGSAIQAGDGLLIEECVNQPSLSMQGVSMRLMWLGGWTRASYDIRNGRLHQANVERFPHSSPPEHLRHGLLRTYSSTKPDIQ